MFRDIRTEERAENTNTASPSRYTSADLYSNYEINYGGAVGGKQSTPEQLMTNRPGGIERCYCTTTRCGCFDLDVLQGDKSDCLHSA